MALDAGTTFAGEYRIERSLGQGGMGSVHLAVQLTTGRRRALKTIHAHISRDPKSLERFQQEARIGAEVENDHIVEVVGAGVDSSTGTPWIAMELLEGETLQERWQRDGRLAPSDVMAIFMQLCDGLAAAHEKGIVHRDLKPENIFLAKPRRRDVAFTVKILDFGIAKWIQETRSAADNSQVIGTPLWMAPEQTDTTAQIRPATDVWALGLIAFALLTGKHYWKACADPVLRLPALWAEVLGSEIEPPSQRALALGYLDPLPQGFDQWFLECVARDATSRPRHAGDALDSLVKAFGVGAFDTTRPREQARVEQSKDDLHPASVPTRPLAARAGPPTNRSVGNADLAKRRAWRFAPFVVAPSLVATIMTAWLVSKSSSHNPEEGTTQPITTGQIPTEQPALSAPSLTVTTTPSKSASTLNQGDCPISMVAVSGGAVWIGSRDGEGDEDEHPRYRVTLAPYCIGRTEVTTEEYSKCVTAMRCPQPDTGMYCNSGKIDKNTHPINCIDWHSAKAYCDWIGARLPTEEEWELAARGTDARNYPWGKAEPTDDVCWKRHPGGGSCTTVDYRTDTAPSGAKGMGGNVQEWTSSPYCSYRRKDCTDSRQVVRGGSWLVDDPKLLRAAARDRVTAAFRRSTVGFRCARAQ